MEETLFTPPLGRNAALLRNDGIGKEARPGTDKAENQKCRSQGIGRIFHRESKRDRAVDQEIHRNIEIATKIGLAGRTRNRPIKPVEESV